MKFLLCLVMIFLIVNGFATSQSLIQDSCNKAAAKDPKFKLDFCVKSLQENPESNTATTIDELVMASTNNAATKMTSLKETVDKILKENKYEKGSEMPLRDCLDLYTDATDSLNEALASVKSRDFETAKQVLSAAMNAPTTCETLELIGLFTV